METFLRLVSRAGAALGSIATGAFITGPGAGAGAGAAAASGADAGGAVTPSGLTPYGLGVPSAGDQAA